MFALCIEASHQRGMGHLFRMLNFSKTLVERGVPFRVVVNPDAVAEALLAKKMMPFDTVPMTSKSDWQTALIRKHRIGVWIDDRLDTDAIHGSRVESCGVPRVTFDDRGPGAELADLNVVAMSFDNKEALPGRRVLRGTQYLVLNPDIRRYRRLRTSAGSIVVTMGGSDTYGVTEKVVRMLKSIGRHATIIAGPAFAHESDLVDLLDDGFVLKRNVPSLIEEFSHHGLAITGGGVTPFEANASGLPCIVIATEPFEIPVGMGIANFGGAVFAGHHSDIDASLFSAALPIEKMSKAAMENIDLGGAARVADQIGGLF